LFHKKIHQPLLDFDPTALKMAAWSTTSGLNYPPIRFSSAVLPNGFFKRQMHAFFKETHDGHGLPEAAHSPHAFQFIREFFLFFYPF
jgi:hypothetical protein